MFSIIAFSWRYWRFSEESRVMDKDYPKPVSVWGSIPSSPKGAFLSDDGGESGWGDGCPRKCHSWMQEKRETSPLIQSWEGKCDLIAEKLGRNKTFDLEIFCSHF